MNSLGLIASIFAAAGIATSSSRWCLIPLGIALTLGVLGAFASDNKTSAVGGILTALAGIIAMCQFAGFIPTIDLGDVVANMRKTEQTEEQNVNDASTEQTKDDSAEESKDNLVEQSVEDFLNDNSDAVSSEEYSEQVDEAAEQYSEGDSEGDSEGNSEGNSEDDMQNNSN